MPLKLDELPTEEALLQVRRFECSQFGHTYIVMEDEDRLRPRFVHCPHCTQQWPCIEPRAARARRTP